MNPISDARTPDTDNDALRYGVVIRPPVYRLDARAFVCSQLLHVDREALAEEGVTVVADGNFVGVVATSHEAARRAAARLPLRWSTPDRDATAVGPAATDARLRRDYQWPGRLAWGAEPDWVIADFIDGGLRLAGPVASTERLRGELACLLESDPQRIHIDGDAEAGLGRQGSDDAAADAALLARAIGRPVAVRLDPDPYARDAEALARARRLRVSGTADGDDFRVDDDLGYVSVPPLALWLTGRLTENLLRDPDAAALQFTFVQESFLDEVAAALGEDPVALRLRHIKDPRGRQLLKSVADQAAWDHPVENDGGADLVRGRGVAYSHRPSESGDAGSGTRSAWIADVEVNTVTGGVRLSRLVAGQDAGADGPLRPLLDATPLRDTLERKLLGLPSSPPPADDWAAPADRKLPAWRPSSPPARRDAPGTPALSEGVDLSPAVAVVANALYDATGVRFRSPPFSPARVRAALEARARPGKRRWWWAGALAVTGLLATLWPFRPSIAPVARPAANLYSAETIERGRLVAEAGDCAVCHTAEGGTVNLGGRPFETPFGTLYSTNLTPDPDTGIGNWSYAAFERAMREGIGRDGRHLYPAFPYTDFAKISDTDMQALYAYLMAQPAVAAPAPQNELRFPFNIRSMMAGWNLLFHDPAPFKPDPSRSAQWNRGAYLFEGAGHCGACHTPRNLFGAEKGGDARLSGALVDGWEAPALTAASRSPAGWTEQSLFEYLRTGRSDAHGVAGGPMAPVVAGLAELPEDDVRAIAHYVATQMDAPLSDPAQSERAAAVVAASRAAPVGQEAGQRVFEGACAACHENGTATFTSAKQALALNTNLHSQRPDNVIQSILGGVHAEGVAGAGEMPAFVHSLSDRQIVDLVQYLRARFAPGETPWKEVGKTVADLRREHDQQ